MHTRKHLLVPPDHRDDDSVSKSLELVSFHLQGRRHLPQRLVTYFLGHEGQIPTDLAKRKRAVHLLDGTVRFIEKRLRVRHDRFCNGSHRVVLFDQANV
jgi:hypothetical protein